MHSCRNVNFKRLMRSPKRPLQNNVQVCINTSLQLQNWQVTCQGLEKHKNRISCYIAQHARKIPHRIKFCVCERSQTSADADVGKGRYISIRKNGIGSTLNTTNQLNNY